MSQFATFVIRASTIIDRFTSKKNHTTRSQVKAQTCLETIPVQPLQPHNSVDHMYCGNMQQLPASAATCTHTCSDDRKSNVYQSQFDLQHWHGVKLSAEQVSTINRCTMCNDVTTCALRMKEITPLYDSLKAIILSEIQQTCNEL